MPNPENETHTPGRFLGYQYPEWLFILLVMVLPLIATWVRAPVVPARSQRNRHAGPAAAFHGRRLRCMDRGHAHPVQAVRAPGEKQTPRPLILAAWPANALQPESGIALLSEAPPKACLALPAESPGITCSLLSPPASVAA